MNRDDDIAAALPQPPPPAPARREAAIGAALRRFDDGAGAASGTANQPRAATRRRWLSRPQAGVLVSAALVAVVALPVAWNAFAPQPTVDGGRIAAPAPPRSGVPATAAAPEPGLPDQTADAGRAMSQAAPPGIVAAPPGETVPAPAPTPVAAPPPPAPPPPPPPPPAPPPAAADAMVAGNIVASRERQELAPGSRASAEAKAGIASARAPSPAPAPSFVAGEDDDARGDIVVTSNRRTGPVRRGDWNACTINDPRQDLAACRRQLGRGARAPSGDAAARIADGLQQAWQGDLARAVGAFDQAIAADPKSSVARLNRGLAHARLGNLDRAIADLDEAVRQAPRMARNYYNRSLLLRQRGDERRARSDAQRAVDLDPSYADALR